LFAVTYPPTELLSKAKGPPSTGATAPAGVSPADWDHSTLRLNKADLTLFQALGDTAQRRPCLILYSGDNTGTRYPLQGPRMTLGRSPECDVCLENLGISRRHAELREVGDTVTLYDLGSSNGTHLNEQRIQAPVELKDGDVVRLGSAVLKFYERQSLDALLHDRIYRLATVDSGTEVYTKKYLLEALEREVKLARRTGRPLSVMCLDLDNFKSVNDRFGHNAGDLVLRSTAAAAQERLRGSDILGRMGGEEFAVVLPDTELQAAIELAEKVRTAVSARSFELTAPKSGQADPPAGPVKHKQTVSIGVTQLTQHTLDVRDLLGAADAMLYAAKRNGRNRVSA
jgi:two-component system cell cycle response regulator